MKKILIALVPLLALSACTNQVKTAPVEVKKPINPQIYSQSTSQNPQMIQTDRYTLVELEDPTQNYVLDQIIDTSLPKNLPLTVKDGLDYVLNQSGYSLCQNRIIEMLYNKKLPKVQYKIGPVKLSDALQIMAGPAWQLTVDDVEREVCFKLNDGYEIKLPTEAVIIEEVVVQSPINNNGTNQSNTYTLPPKNIKSSLSEVKHLAEPLKSNTKGTTHE